MFKIRVRPWAVPRSSCILSAGVKQSAYVLTHRPIESIGLLFDPYTNGSTHWPRVWLGVWVDPGTDL